MHIKNTPSACRDPSQNKLALIVAWGLGAAATAAMAQTTDAPVALPDVVVSGARSEQSRADVPLSMEVLGARELENRQIGDIKDLVTDMPNVSVKHAPARFTVTGAGNPTGRDGNAGFNIRGLGSNRVLMLIDGVRLPSSYINGNNAFGRDTVSLELLKRVEVVRGPSSVLYGSSALAGLVNLITYEPNEFLAASGVDAHAAGGRLAASWSGADDGRALAATVAGRDSEKLQWMLTGSVRRAAELQNMGSNDAANVDRTRPNPQTQQGESLLAKLVYRTDAFQKHVLTAEHVAKSFDIDLLSSRSKAPLVAASVSAEADAQNQRRDRLTWDARYWLHTAWADQLETVLGMQNADAQDDGRTVRNDAGVRLRDTHYNERTWQVSVQAIKIFQISDEWSHKLTYGVDCSRTMVSNWFGGFDPAPLTPYVPKKYFPDSIDTSVGFYVQTELRNNQWSVTPGLRWESFAVDVVNQNGYAPPATVPGISVAGTNVSPKLGVLYRWTPSWSLYGNYASGFRAPNAAQINGFTDPSPGVNARLLANPGLVPETSKNLELGARLRLGDVSLDVAAFTSKFNQLIVDKKPLGGSNTVADPLIFQTQNIDDASIWGFEFKGDVYFGTVAGGRLTAPFAYGQSRGQDDGTGRPLNSVDPATLSLGLHYATGDWTMRLDTHFHAAKNTQDIDPVAGVKVGSSQFSSVPAVQTVDLSGQWRIRRDMRLNASVQNLTDRKYWLWSDVQGLTASNAVVQADAYTQPGRHFKVSWILDF